MNDEINEQLSALMDGELTVEEIEAVLQAFKAEEQVRRRWANYHLVRDSLQGHLPEVSLRDLTQEVARALEQEPTLLMAPHSAAADAVTQQLPLRWKYAAGLALAASLSAITVLGIQALTGEETMSEAPVAMGPSVSPDAEAVSVLDDQHWAVLEPEVKERLNTYLVNHTEYVDMPGMLRYGRIVSYESSR